jgi:hypothetical protein
MTENQNNADDTANDNSQANGGDQTQQNQQQSPDNQNINQNTDITDPGQDGGDTDSQQQTPEDKQAPESYAEFTLPEGMTADNVLLQKAIPIFKEMGLSQENAQKLVDLQAESIQSNDKLINETMEKWETELKADKEIGGEKFDENIGIANMAAEKLQVEGLVEFLENSGLGSHPLIVKVLWKVGSMMKEDSPGSGSPSTQEKDVVETMYPDDKPTET